MFYTGLYSIVYKEYMYTLYSNVYIQYMYTLFLQGILPRPVLFFAFTTITFLSYISYLKNIFALWYYAIHICVPNCWCTSIPYLWSRDCRDICCSVHKSEWHIYYLENRYHSKKYFLLRGRGTLAEFQECLFFTWVDCSK